MEAFQKKMMLVVESRKSDTLDVQPAAEVAANGDSNELQPAPVLKPTLMGRSAPAVPAEV